MNCQADIPTSAKLQSCNKISHAPNWQVYLLECADGTFYCGVTSNLARRLAQHNGKLTGGARYTQTRRPVRLCAAFSCTGRSEAQRQEALIKKLPRAHKLAFFTQRRLEE